MHANNALYLQELNGQYNGAGSDGTFATAPTNASGNQYLMFTGGLNVADTAFDTPIYRVTPNDTSYMLTKLSGAFFVPAEFLSGGAGIRVPEVAKNYFLVGGATSSDAPMLIIDEYRGYHANLAKVLWNSTNSRWEVQSGGSAGITYTSSYGFDSNTAQSGISAPAEWSSGVQYYQDDQRNHGGFRGNNPMTRVVDYDRMIAEGSIPYILEMFAVRTGNALVFPMVGYESGKGGIIPEGTRMHLKSSITDAQILSRLSADGLSGTALNQAAMIARALRDYGTYVGDNAGTGSRIKLQNFGRESRSNPWLISPTALRVFDFRAGGDWEVIADNYDPPLA